MAARKDARLRRVGPVACAILLSLLAIGGCAAPPKHRGPSVAWDQARLGAMLRLADEQITTGKFQQARDTLAMYHDSTDTRLVCALARVDVEEGNYEAALRRLEPITSPAATLPPAPGFETATKGCPRYLGALFPMSLASRSIVAPGV